jgi:tRNA (cytidine/uridine-2'-O-)-methyltransferase
MRLAVFEPDIAANLGAMIRSASCFGAGVDVIAPCGFPLSHKGLRRAAMDYMPKGGYRLHDSWDAFRPTVPGRLILLSTRADVPLHRFSFATDDTLVVGRESAGVPADVAESCDAALCIAMPGGGRSLNVSVAAGIALHAGAMG